MRFQILFTLLFVSMSVASIFDGTTKISRIPYCAMRSAAFNLAHAVLPTPGIYSKCTYWKQACYGAGGGYQTYTTDGLSMSTNTTCDVAFTACIAANGVNRANFQLCMHGIVF
jgi:hypothetical protein